MARPNKPLPLPEELSPQVKQLQQVINEEGDLQCALIATAFLDHCVGSLLQQYLVDGETSIGLLQPGSALSSLATRTQLAYCLGLISKGISADIQLLGRIRNIFAHGFIDITFSNAEVVKLCDGLKGEGTKEFLALRGLSARAIFSVSVFLISNKLIVMSSRTQHRERKKETEVIWV